MSKAFLEKILKEELRALKEDSEFVRETSDTKAHKFSSSVVGVKNEINKQLMEGKYASPEVLNSQEVQTIVDEVAKELVNRSYTNLKTWTAGIDNAILEGNKSAFSITAIVSTGGFSFKDRRYVTELTVFDTIKESYRKSKGYATSRLNNVLSASGQQTKKLYGQYFLDLDHRQGSVISKQEVNQSKARLSSKISNRNDRSSQDKITNKDLEDLGLTLEVSKKDTKAQTVIGVGLRAAKLNRGSDSQKQKAAKQRYIKKLEEAVVKLNNSEKWAKRRGSDSRLTIEKKKIIEAFDKAVKDKGSKNLKQKSEDYKPNYSNSKVSKKVSKKPTAGTQKKVPVGKLGIKKGRPSKSSAESSITLAALINQKLPATVAKNMGLPALVYRTGRFANSVRVTDVTRTTKGFPSIGYTYQRNPYQTFERGYRQGSEDRDPRKLIDKSIREIATGLLVGRFYTRRV